MATLNHIILQPVMIQAVAVIHVQDFPLDLVKPHEVHRVPVLKLILVPLYGIPPLRHVNLTTQLAEAALKPTVCVINITQYYS